MCIRGVYSKSLPDPLHTVECLHPELPKFMTLEICSGTFEVVKIDPNTDKRTIAWSASHRSEAGCLGGETVTTMPVEQFAGQLCAMARLETGDHETVLIGLRTLEGGAVNEQNPHTLRPLSLWPVEGKAGDRMENILSFFLSGRRWPKKSTANVALTALLLHYVILPCLAGISLPLFLVLWGVLDNALLSFLLAFILPPLALIGGYAAFHLYWNPGITSPNNYVHNEESARALVRDILRDLDTRDCFTKSMRESEERGKSWARLDREAAERRTAAGQPQPGYLY